MTVRERTRTGWTVGLVVGVVLGTLLAIASKAAGQTWRYDPSLERSSVSDGWVSSLTARCIVGWNDTSEIGYFVEITYPGHGRVPPLIANTTLEVSVDGTLFAQSRQWPVEVLGGTVNGRWPVSITRPLSNGWTLRIVHRAEDGTRLGLTELSLVGARMALDWLGCAEREHRRTEPQRRARAAVAAARADSIASLRSAEACKETVFDSFEYRYGDDKRTMSLYVMDAPIATYKQGRSGTWSLSSHDAPSWISYDWLLLQLVRKLPEALPALKASTHHNDVKELCS